MPWSVLQSFLWLLAQCFAFTAQHFNILFTLSTHQLCCLQEQAAVSSEKALINPPFTNCSAPNSRQTATSWWAKGAFPKQELSLVSSVAVPAFPPQDTRSRWSFRRFLSPTNSLLRWGGWEGSNFWKFRNVWIFTPGKSIRKICFLELLFQKSKNRGTNQSWQESEHWACIHELHKSKWMLCVC